MVGDSRVDERAGVAAAERWGDDTRAGSTGAGDSARDDSAAGGSEGDSASRGGTAVSAAQGSRECHTTTVESGAEGFMGEGEAAEAREAESAGTAERRLPDGEVASAGISGRDAVAEGSAEGLAEGLVEREADGLAEGLAERIRTMVDAADMGAVQEAQGASLGALQDTAAILAHFNAFSLKALACEAPTMRAHTAALQALQADLMRTFRKIREMKAKLRKAFPNAFKEGEEIVALQPGLQVDEEE
ncbi:unnamed protein product [Closterium sp. NIES-54]